MLLEVKFFIKHYSKVFLIKCSFNLNIVETNGWMTLKLFFENITSWAGVLGSGLKTFSNYNPTWRLIIDSAENISTFCFHL